MNAHFVIKDCPNFGIGWVPKNKPYFDPGHGQLVAHDVLEEFPNGGEQPEDEFMALGAMLYGRGQGDFFLNSKITPGHMLCYDALEIFRHIQEEEGYALKDSPKTKKLTNTEYDSEWIEEQICEFENKVLDIILSDYEYDLGEFSDSSQLETNISKILNKSLTNNMANWLRIGVRKAHKRFFPKILCDEITYFFNQIKTKVDNITPYPNDKLKINIDMNYKRMEIKYYSSMEHYWFDL